MMPARTTTGVAIRTHELVKAYRMGEVDVAALRGANLVVEHGEFAVVLGPSGCGKTTLLNLVGGMERPTAGRAVVDDCDLADLDDRALTRFRREKIGFVFQFFNLVPALTARENVELAAELAEHAHDPVAILRALGLGGREDAFPGELSGGEQQRVAIARALVKAPPILLCDEATGNLDAQTGREILALLRRVNREQRCTVLFVTHNAAIAAIADRVVRMESGIVASVEVQRSPADPADVRW